MKAPLANVIAFVFLAAFVILTILLYSRVDDPNNELQWARYVYLYGGVEAIAFAAAGYLFGKEVNRQRAESAEEAAAANAEKAQNGVKLAEAVRTAGTLEPTDANVRLMVAEQGSSLNALVTRANKLFPD